MYRDDESGREKPYETSSTKGRGGGRKESYSSILIFRTAYRCRMHLDYTGCTLKLRAVKLLFVVFGRLSYSPFKDVKSNLSVHAVYIFSSVKRCNLSVQK